MTRTEYQQYLASREWAILKRAVSKRSQDTCERCRYGSYEETHHLTYERIGHERPEDLLAVCSDCHRYLSGRSELDPLAFNNFDKASSCLKALATELESLYDLNDPKGKADAILELMARVMPHVHNPHHLSCVLTLIAEIFEVPSDLLFKRAGIPI